MDIMEENKGRPRWSVGVSTADTAAHSDLGGSNFRFFYPHFSFYFWVAIVVKYQKFVVATGFLSFKYQFFDNLFSNLFNFRRQIRKTQIPR